MGKLCVFKLNQLLFKPLSSSIPTGIENLVSSNQLTIAHSKSVWGTLKAPTFPLFLTNNPLPSGFPWGGDTASGTNPYTQYPNTGVIRTYDFTISRGVIAPDGYQKNVLLVNGAFPGPQIEANWGDTIQVTVHNSITGPEEGTAIHWHGMLQKGTPYMVSLRRAKAFSIQDCFMSPAHESCLTRLCSITRQEGVIAHSSNFYRTVCLLYNSAQSLQGLLSHIRSRQNSMEQHGTIPIILPSIQVSDLSPLASKYPELTQL
jgi:hypothetical protein